MIKTTRNFFAFFCLSLFFMPAIAPAADHDPMEVEMNELNLFMAADQLVETATRSPKPVSQVAENVTIITAEQIEAMNAHHVSEVLNRVPGLRVESAYTDFGQSAGLHIHGSEFAHVLVLVDGMRWSYVSFDYAETNTIPVQIIERIEVIKGPASSSWGSSLGGVVNIITKETGEKGVPAGTLYTSYGERNTSDLRVDGAGKAGPLGYYLYAGRQESDGLRDTRFFDNQNFFGKFSLDLPRDMELGATLGYSRPDYKYYYLPQWDDQGEINDRVFWGTVNFAAPMADNYTFNFSAYRFEDTFTDNWQFISTGRPYNILEYEGLSYGANARLVRATDFQTIVLGTEFEGRETTTHDKLAPYSSPEIDEEVWAVFLNDTIRFGDLTVIPGLRYDHLSITDDELSPSLGLTYRVSDTTLLRGNIARGFRKPFPTVVEGDPYFYLTNPQIVSETIWSYQAGVETSALPFLYLKATLFDHRASDTWVRDPATWALVNHGDYERQGIEMVVQTDTWHHLSLRLDGTAIRMKPDLQEDDTHYLANALLEYDDNTWQGQFFGHYLKLGDVRPPVTAEPKTDTIIWDAVLQRRFFIREGLQASLFVALHNIFNEEQYVQFYFPTAPRWVEAGVRIKF